MKEINVVDGPQNVYGGVVKLSKALAKHRMHNLKPISGKEGWYEVINRIQFKTGDSYSYQEAAKESKPKK